MKREQDEISACTFKPQLNNLIEINDPRGLIERNEAWLFAKEKRLERERKK